MGIMDILRPKSTIPKKVPEQLVSEPPKNNQEIIAEYLKNRTKDLNWAVEKQQEYSVPTTNNQKLAITGNGNKDRILMYLFEVNSANPLERKAICGLNFTKENGQWQIDSTYLDSSTHLPRTEVKVSEDMVPFQSLMRALELVAIRKSLKEETI